VRKIGLLAVGLVVALPVAAGGRARSGDAASRREPKWTLTWSDEFNGRDGSAPDPTKWKFDVGGGGWGNKELEGYTARPENVVERGGNLVISARKEEYTGKDGIARHYTSGRIKTEGRFAQVYGRFEARMKLPAAKGIWPAFWMLGRDIAAVNWPNAGEIDILEAIGDPGTIYSTLHGPGYRGANAISKKFPLPEGEKIDTGFHIYAVEWAPEEIRFYFDDHLIAERTPKDLPAGTKWVYDHPFFLLLDVAVGGAWPGDPDETTAFPQLMLVDYVRVYRRS
jgi:beta-glucanase (GH16 family)